MNGDASAILDLVRLGLAGVLIAAGLGFVLLGAVGMLRFPDFYTRLHAFSVTETIGGALLLAGLALAAWDMAIALKLLLLALLMAAAAPTIAHLTANAGHAAGLAPLSGDYVAPRPGANSGANSGVREPRV